MSHITSEQAEDNESLESHRRLASAFLRLLAVSLPIVGVVLYYGAGRNWPGAVLREAPATPSASPREPAPAVEATSSGVAGTTANPATPAVRTDLIRVGVSTVRPCWVFAIVDGATALQRQLSAGESLMLEVRRELVLTAGDAGALTLTLNGENARPLGNAGEVVTTRVNLSNFKEYLASR